MSSLTVAGISLPFFELGSIDVGIKLQWFGILVATGVLLGASLCRRYGDKFGIDEEDLRGMTAWVVVSGFLGAHLFDVLAYQQDELAHDPLILVKVWKGISSYGGFIGGAVGWFLFQWWKRLQSGLWADIIGVGLLPGFTIGRIGCTVVSDHIGAPTKFFLGMDYPLHEVKGRLCPYGDCPAWLDEAYQHGDKLIRLHNLGLNELLYLLLVNAIVLYLAFRKKPHPAGLLAALIGVLYAPVRFFFEYLRPDQTDPRYLGLTFAQWASIVAFTAALGLLVKIIRDGAPATPKAQLGPKEIGGRRGGGPRLRGKDLAALERPASKDADGGSKKGA